ncbi:Oxysterol-binding protein-related protein like [Heracleum sosnowskyi]|uniref:Oxysterol-binding protein-related protein like n=1 Tax=Heracleum sosnowskyi TaxID=360622 RepID=A0AAD8H5P1_9APIA|nr:Oxysterol-binding protein-related protein like [Heracleum sosnowskyi]
MAPHGESLVSSYARTSNTLKPPRLSSSETTGLKRSVSDVSYELSKEDLNTNTNTKTLPPISEVEDARCECCGMTEECTLEYIERIREMFMGKWICGLCTEAVKEEMDKNGGKREEALNTHMGACVRFNKFGRAYPVLYQAQAMREILKKARAQGRGVRAKSMNCRDINAGLKKGGIARSTSCIPAITREMNDLKVAK